MKTKKTSRNRSGYVQPNRQSTKVIAGHFEPSLHDAMRAVAKHTGQSLQEAMAKAFEEYIEKNFEQLASPAGPERPTKPSRQKRDRSPDC
jgi:hypothetical protein